MVECAIRLNDTSESVNFLNDLNKLDRAKIVKIIKKFANVGSIHNKEQFRKVEGEIWEFKEFQRRIFAYFSGKGCIVLTHGVIKKGNKAKRKEIDKANQIVIEYAKIRKGFKSEP